MTAYIVICVGCGKAPDEIDEYLDAAHECGTSPIDYVMENEGTLNRSNGHFYCTECYIEAGEPLGVAR